MAVPFKAAILPQPLAGCRVSLEERLSFLRIILTLPWGTQMTGEGESLQDLEGASKLDQAREAVLAATNTVKATSRCWSEVRCAS